MKTLEAEVRLKDRMAAVGELSAGIAHEIRNPLAAIAGSVQVLKKSAALNPQEQRLMSIILKESERLNKSIADFLRFVRPQDKRTTEFDIAVSLSETLDLLANSPELGPDHHIERQIAPASFAKSKVFVTRDRLFGIGQAKHPHLGGGGNYWRGSSGKPSVTSAMIASARSRCISKASAGSAPRPASRPTPSMPVPRSCGARRSSPTTPASSAPRTR